jgi:hypothetical protein
MGVRRIPQRRAIDLATRAELTHVLRVLDRTTPADAT